MGLLQTSGEIERFAAKVVWDCASGCAVWTGAVAGGRGRFNLRGRTVLAHRTAWLTWRGPVPHGKELDHLCRNPRCVNLNHLEPVSHRVNMLRGINPIARWAARTHCSAGHDLAPYRAVGAQECLACSDARRRARQPRINDLQRARRARFKEASACLR